MNLTEHKESLMSTGEDIIAFELTTRKGEAMGFLHGGVLVIHHIYGRGAVKGLMSILCNRFGTRKFRFTMIINPELKNIIHGNVKIIPPDDPGNPFGETLETIEGTWNS